MKLSAKTISYCAILIALSVLLRKFLTIPLPAGVLNFGGFPIILAGLMMGPAAGALTGALSDIAGAAIAPHGPYIPFFTITSAITGIIPPVIVKFFPQKDRSSFPAALAAAGAAQIATKILMIPFIMQFCFGIPAEIYMVKSIAAEIIHIPAYAFFSHEIIKALNRRK
ncbi:MAG: folate family ECF transporter S component [bacterium]|nr:folate family ECF transporter S component [bacterium]